MGKIAILESKKDAQIAQGNAGDRVAPGTIKLAKMHPFDWKVKPRKPTKDVRMRARRVAT